METRIENGIHLLKYKFLNFSQFKNKEKTRGDIVQEFRISSNTLYKIMRQI